MYAPTKIDEPVMRALVGLPGKNPILLYLILSSLGAHRSDGWHGSTRKILEEIERLGGSTTAARVHDAIVELSAAGLLERQLSRGVDSTFRLVANRALESEVSPEMVDTEMVGTHQSGRYQNENRVPPKTRTGFPPKREHPLRSGEERRREESIYGEPGDSVEPPHPGISTRRILVRDGKLAPMCAPADGLADDIRAAGLRRSDRQVELLVADAGSDEVRRQLAWLPRRDASWCAGKPGALERWFEKMCREHECEPSGTDGGAKPYLSPDAVAVLRDELRDRHATKGAVAKALKAVGAQDLDHITAEQRRGLLEALEASKPAAPMPDVVPGAERLLAALSSTRDERTSSLPSGAHLNGQALADAKRRAKGEP